MIEFNLKGKRALVTGSASGIGFATAALLVRSGARVASNDLPGAPLAAAEERSTLEGLAVEAVPGDLGVRAYALEVGASALVAYATAKAAALSSTSSPPAER